MSDYLVLGATGSFDPGLPPGLCRGPIGTEIRLPKKLWIHHCLQRNNENKVYPNTFNVVSEHQNKFLSCELQAHSVLQSCRYLKQFI